MVTFDISHPVPLRISAVERLQVNRLGRNCSEAGVYLLLERPSQDGAWEVYVGKSAADGGVKRRLLNHLSDAKKPSWYKAVAVCPASGSWDEAQVRFVEGLVYKALLGMTGVSLSNTQEPGTGNLKENRQTPLFGVPKVLKGVLALLGHSVVSSDSQQTRDLEKPSRPGKLAGLLQAGLVKAGTKLVGLDRRWPGEGIVTVDGCIDAAGETYRSPSGAAKAISGRQSESGWDFWAVESSDGPTLYELRERLESGSVIPPINESDHDKHIDVKKQSEDQPEGAGARELSAKAPRKQDVKLAEIVASGLIPVGAKVVSTSKKWPAEGRILNDGRIETGGDAFESPSGAASAVAGGTSVNGWIFWAIDKPEGERLAEVKRRFSRSI